MPFLGQEKRDGLCRETTTTLTILNLLNNSLKQEQKKMLLQGAILYTGEAHLDKDFNNMLKAIVESRITASRHGKFLFLIYTSS